MPDFIADYWMLLISVSWAIMMKWFNSTEKILMKQFNSQETFWLS